MTKVSIPEKKKLQSPNIVQALFEHHTAADIYSQYHCAYQLFVTLNVAMFVFWNTNMSQGHLYALWNPRWVKVTFIISKTATVYLRHKMLQIWRGQWKNDLSHIFNILSKSIFKL